MRVSFFLVLAGSFFLLVGCTTTRVFLPDTRDAKACQRECMAIANSCNPRRSDCDEQEQSCLRTCPGAYEREVPFVH